MKNKYTKLGLASAFAMALLTHSVNAAEENTSNDYSGGFLKLGLGYKFDKNPYESEQNGLSVFINGRYQMDIGLFIEAAFGANKRQEGLNIGYNFYNTENWHYDITTVTAFGSTEIIATIIDPDGTIITATDEKDSSQMLGLRATGNFNNSNVQFLVAPLLLGSDYEDGVYVSAWAGHAWQVKNWELYASAGLEYRSENILDHYFEPTEALQRVGVPAYNATGGIDATVQFSASYPVSESILFEAYARHTNYSNSITDSPVIDSISQLPGRSKTKNEIGVLLSYVF